MSGSNREIFWYTGGDDSDNTTQSSRRIGTVSRYTDHGSSKSIVFYKKRLCQDHEEELQGCYYTWWYGSKTHRGIVGLGRGGNDHLALKLDIICVLEKEWGFMLYMRVYFVQAYVPILSNPKNHKGWPRVVGEDVKRHIYDLRSIICQVRESVLPHSAISTYPQRRAFRMDYYKHYIE